MISFYEFYEMIDEAKEPTFRQYITSLYNDILSIPDVKNASYTKNKPEITLTDYERAQFTTRKSFPKLKNSDEQTIIRETDKWHEGIAALLGIKSKPEIHFMNKDRIFEYKDVKLKNGITVSYTSTTGLNYNIPLIDDTFKFTGKKLDVATEFATYPEYKPGAILYTSFGYNMTIVHFYQIVKRSGNMIYSRLLKNDYVTGGGYSGKVAAKKNDFDTTSHDVFTSRLPNTKIDGQYASLWDGKPVYYNTMD